MRLSCCSLLFATATLCSAQSTQLNPNPPSNGTPAVRVLPAPRSMDLESRPPMVFGPGNPASQAGCPVVLTSVSLEPNARYMPVETPGKTAGSPNLDLQFRNMSGKKILSVDVEARLKYKRSVYDLDSTDVEVFLTLPGTAITDQKREQARVIPLQLPAFSVGSVMLRKLAYTDGTVWSADARNACGLNATGADRIAK